MNFQNKKIAFITDKRVMTEYHGIRTLVYSLIYKLNKLGVNVHIVNFELKGKKTVATLINLTEQDLLNRGFNTAKCVGKSRKEILYLLKNNRKEFINSFNRIEAPTLPLGEKFDFDMHFDISILSAPNVYKSELKNINSDRLYCICHDVFLNRFYFASPDEVNVVGNEYSIAYQFADSKNGILCTTEEVKRQCEIFGFGKKKGLKVLPLVLPPGYERVTTISESRDKTAILASPLNKRKGMNLIPHLLNAGNFDRINIFGRPSGCEISDIINFFEGINVENINWWIDIDFETQKELYLNSRVLLFPSVHEGLGIPLLEAYACGCSALVSDTHPLNQLAYEKDVLPADKKSACDKLIEHLEKIPNPKFYQNLIQSKTESFDLQL